MALQLTANRASFAVALLCFAAIASAEPAVVRVSGPTMVGFFPPTWDADSSGQTAAQGKALVLFALSHTEDCLAIPELEKHFEVATKLILETRDARYFLELPTEQPRSVGVYMFTPGERPQPVYATTGPSSLALLLPDAAASYFDAPGCSH